MVREAVTAHQGRKKRHVIVHKDVRLEKGYITECSASVAFYLGRPTFVGLPALDLISPQERHEEYQRRYKNKGKDGSTRPRRSD